MVSIVDMYRIYIQTYIAMNRKKSFKRLLSFVVALICVGQIVAQQTGIYTNSERKLEEGTTLYYQQHYAASQNMLMQYIASQGAQDIEKAQFFLASNSFELRQNDAQQLLDRYLLAYPYTTYSSEVHFMLGTLLIEKRKFKQANKHFDKVEISELSRDHQPTLLFYKGYAHLEMQELQQAAQLFYRLKEQESLYQLQAQYYYSVCQYLLGNYGKALPGFLRIENSELYKDIVPYYIVQIYYQQKQYDEVYARAERLLAIEKDSENSGELHRMLGEIYYQQGKYEQAQQHLLAYEESFTKHNKQLLREDLYLLGMSYFQMHDYEKAVLWLNKVKKTNDELSQNTCMNTGNAYVKLGHTELAKVAYSAAMRYDFDPVIKEEAMYNYALTTYQSSSALGESITAFTDFLKAYPESKHKEQVWTLMTDVFLSSKNYQAGYDAICQIENPSPKIVETKHYLQYQLAVEAFEQGNTAKAIDLFTAVINDTKGSSNYKTESYYWRAEAYYRLRDYDKAKNDVSTYRKQKNADKSNNYEPSKYLMGYIYFSEKSYQEAQKEFSEYILKADPASATYADALNRIGDCHFHERDFSKAEKCYSQVIAIGSTGADYAIFQRGYALGLLKRYNDKINVLERLVNTYPRSDYADDALYETARAFLMQDKNDEAVKTYDRLLTDYPNSNMARKAALEKAMTYYNMSKLEEAIVAYKQVIKQYPQSEEAYLALDGLQAAYVETNNIADYVAYTKTLGKSKMVVTNKEDSLLYITAERQYMLANYKEAAEGFNTYISKFCTGGRYCTHSQYYLADSYYRLGKRHEALVEYKKLCQMTGNPFMEEACLRAAEITYDDKDYKTSLEYFRMLQKNASSSDKLNVARLGVLRCSYLTGDNESTINISTEIIDDNTASDDVIREAHYNRGKAFYNLHQNDLALADLQLLASDVRRAEGAEAKYMCAQIYFDIKQTDKAEEEIMNFAKLNTSHQFWLAKSFILLSDIYVEKDDLFQAKQYLLSLQNNYKPQDEIQDIIKQRLSQIEQKEKQSNEEDNENDEEE